MKLSTRLRLISLSMLIIAVVFLFCALSCPTCTVPRVLAPFAGAFYKLYAAAIPLLFVLSFFLPKK